jgi:hypothetical protein
MSIINFIKCPIYSGIMVYEDKFEDTKGVTRIRKSKKDRQDNG